MSNRTLIIIIAIAVLIPILGAIGVAIWWFIRQRKLEQNQSGRDIQDGKGRASLNIGQQLKDVKTAPAKEPMITRVGLSSAERHTTTSNTAEVKVVKKAEPKAIDPRNVGGASRLTSADAMALTKTGGLARSDEDAPKKGTQFDVPS